MLHFFSFFSFFLFFGGVGGGGWGRGGGGGRAFCLFVLFVCYCYLNGSLFIICASNQHGSSRFHYLCAHLFCVLSLSLSLSSHASTVSLLESGEKHYIKAIIIISLSLAAYSSGACESRGGRPGMSVLTSLLVSVDVKLY